MNINYPYLAKRKSFHRHSKLTHSYQQHRQTLADGMMNMHRSTLRLLVHENSLRSFTTLYEKTTALHTSSCVVGSGSCRHRYLSSVPSTVTASFDTYHTGCRKSRKKRRSVTRSQPTSTWPTTSYVECRGSNCQCVNLICAERCCCCCGAAI